MCASLGSFPRIVKGDNVFNSLKHPVNHCFHGKTNIIYLQIIKCALMHRDWQTESTTIQPKWINNCTKIYYMKLTDCYMYPGMKVGRVN